MSSSVYYQKLASETRAFADETGLEDKRQQLIEHILWSYNFFTKQKPIRDLNTDQTAILVENMKNCQSIIKENLWRSDLHRQSQEEVESQLKTLSKWGQVHKTLSILIYHSLTSKIDFAAIFNHKGYSDVQKENPAGHQAIMGIHEKGLVQPLELEQLLKRTLNIDTELLHKMYMNQPILLKYTSNNILLLHLVLLMIVEIVKESGVNCLLRRRRAEDQPLRSSQMSRARRDRLVARPAGGMEAGQLAPLENPDQPQVGLMLASQENAPVGQSEAWKESLCKMLHDLIKTVVESTKEVISKLAKSEKSEGLVFVFRELIFLPLVGFLDFVQIKYDVESAQKLQKDLIRAYLKFAPIRPDDWALILYMERYKISSERVALPAFIPHCISTSNTNLVVSAFDSMDKRCVENLSPREIFSIVLFLDPKYLNNKSIQNFCARLNELRSDIKHGEEISIDTYPAIVDLGLAFKLKESVLASLTSTPAALLEPVFCFMLASFTNPSINKYYLESIAKLTKKEIDAGIRFFNNNLSLRVAFYLAAVHTILGLQDRPESMQEADVVFEFVGQFIDELASAESPVSNADFDDLILIMRLLTDRLIPVCSQLGLAEHIRLLLLRIWDSYWLLYHKLSTETKEVFFEAYFEFGRRLSALYHCSISLRARGARKPSYFLHRMKCCRCHTILPEEEKKMRVCWKCGNLEGVSAYSPCIEEQELFEDDFFTDLVRKVKLLKRKVGLDSQYQQEHTKVFSIVLCSLF